MDYFVLMCHILSLTEKTLNHFQWLFNRKITHRIDAKRKRERGKNLNNFVCFTSGEHLATGDEFAIK
jgi:hypothetical protein